MIATKYYSVCENKKSWSKEALTVKSFEDRGYRVQNSRLDDSLLVFMGGHLVARLFKTKVEAANFIGL